jgi:hypothetical protein
MSRSEQVRENGIRIRHHSFGGIDYALNYRLIWHVVRLGLPMDVPDWALDR